MGLEAALEDGDSAFDRGHFAVGIADGSGMGEVEFSKFLVDATNLPMAILDDLPAGDLVSLDLGFEDALFSDGDGCFCRHGWGRLLV